MEVKMERIRVLLADDHRMICAGLAKLLEPHYDVVGCVGDGVALLKAAVLLKPDVVVVDIGMPLLNGLDAARELKKKTPRIKLIFVTMNSDSHIAAEAFQAGAVAYLLKTSPPAELLQAVHDAVRGVSYVTPQISRALEDSSVRDPRALNRPGHLTSRQREVLQMLAEGRSMKEIAYFLEIAHRTVRFHKYRIMEELGITTNSDLVRYAVRHGMISAA
jgi:DNA-binding NarL/FixJ family response regulator